MTDVDNDLVNTVDEKLPEGVDRRQFIGASVATITGGMLAGCLGDGDGDGDGNGDGGGNGSGDGSGAYRIAWANQPSYAVDHAAEQQGFWEDAGIEPPNVESGEGSGDTNRQISSDNDVHYGMSSFESQLSAIEEGHGLTMIGTTKGRAMMILGYNEEEWNGIDNIEDNDIGSGQSTATISWPIFKEEAGIADDFEPEVMETDTYSSLFLQGELDGIFTLFHHWAAAKEQADFPVGGIPIFDYMPLHGYPLSVKSEWLEESEDNFEFAVGLLEGYSHAGKWVLLNPDEAIDMMIDVNPQLGADDRDALEADLKAGVFVPNLTEDHREHGFGYLNEEHIQESIDQYGPHLDIDPDAHSADSVANFDIQEEADLAQFSDDEWDEAVSYAQEYLDTIFPDQY